MLSKYFTLKEIDKQLLYEVNETDLLLDDNCCLAIFHSLFSSVSINVINDNLLIISKFKNLSFGIYEHFGRFLFYAFLNTNNNIFRVYFEKIACVNCNTEYLIANPFVLDCYLVVDTKLSIEIKKTAQLHVNKDCLVCGTKLNRHGFILKKTR